MLGGDLSVVTTEKITKIEDLIRFVFGLQSIYKVFNEEEFKDFNLCYSDFKKIENFFKITITSNNFNDFYPAKEYFENKYSNEELQIKITKAEKIDQLVHIKIRAKNIIELKLGLYLSLAVVALTDGILNSSSFSEFFLYNQEQNFYTSEEWNVILIRFFQK
ncbi:hypothetical protein EG240_15875 [Paenimyroides tangerinum]|uniref:Uncharacterized protein n=1 Tax=Paenimyroides tangerinum TaxID=2488728 RepID=A0A3P3VWH6_9FLAO|nr:hypothetical protein [Paenimyroides tangerinum]RRJ86697.1 hypothetical protein EG240_15875 [Paenimyroides tangerinum]